MATGDLINWTARFGLRGTQVRQGLDIGGGQAAVVGFSDGRRAINIVQAPDAYVAAAAGTPQAVAYARDVRGAAGSQRVPGAALLANGNADGTPAAGTARGAAGPNAAGTGNS